MLRLLLPMIYINYYMFSIGNYRAGENLIIVQSVIKNGWAWMSTPQHGCPRQGMEENYKKIRKIMSMPSRSL